MSQWQKFEKYAIIVSIYFLPPYHMPKVQDLFKKSDGSKLLDVKLLMQLQDIPAEPVEKMTQAGKPLSVYPLTLSYNGEQYEWELNEAQLNRIFTKTDKGGAVYWQAKPGDTVNVWYATPKKQGGYPYFDAEAAEAGAAQTGVEAAEDVFNLTPPTPTPAKPKFVPTSGFKGGAKTEWDGSPRQSSFRQGYAGMIQAILCNPAINPRNPEDVAFALGLAKEMVAEVRVTSKVLETEIKD